MTCIRVCDELDVILLANFACFLSYFFFIFAFISVKEHRYFWIWRFILLSLHNRSRKWFKIIFRSLNLINIPIFIIRVNIIQVKYVRSFDSSESEETPKIRRSWFIRGIQYDLIDFSINCFFMKWENRARFEFIWCHVKCKEFIR